MGASRHEPPGGEPAGQSAVVEHFRRVADGYGTDAEDGLFRYVRRREIKIVEALAGDLRGRWVLDAGCGPGRVARRLVNAGAKVVGVDVCPEMVHLARPWLQESLCADLEHFGLPRRFDLVLCVGALEFTASPGAAFANLARHVAPGGRLIALVPIDGFGGRIYRAVQRRRGLDVHLLRRRELVDWAREAGLASPEWVAPFFHCRVVRFVRPAPVIALHDGEAETGVELCPLAPRADAWVEVPMA